MTPDKNTLDLARQWAADIDADRETLSQDTIDAAADLISSLPDEWVSVDTLRKYIADWREGLATAPRGNYEAEMLDDLEDMLPTPPAPEAVAEVVRLRTEIVELRDRYIRREAISHERQKASVDERDQFHFARFAHSHRRTHEALTRILDGRNNG